MTAIFRIESRNLLRGSLLLTGLFVLLSTFFLAVFPGFADEAELVEDAFPAFLMGLLGFEELHTIEGFVAGYLFPIIWILFAGIYVASVSARMIAADIRTRRMDLILSTPVSRESIVIQKIAALWVPLVAVSSGLFVVIYAGAIAIGESLDPVALAMAHLLGIPYLLVCGGIGIVLSTALDRVERAQITAVGLVFVLWLVEGMGELDPEFERVGIVAPSRYYDPSAILVSQEYALLDAGTLVVAFLVLVGTAILVFVRRDLS